MRTFMTIYTRNSGTSVSSYWCEDLPSYWCEDLPVNCRICSDRGQWGPHIL